jgi:hypothetical protein
MRCQIKRHSSLNSKPQHNSFSTVWRKQNLWSVDDRLRRNPHWRFTIIPSTNAVNLHTVMSGYISSSLLDSPQLFKASSICMLHGQIQTPHWLRLLWTSDRSVITTCTWQHTTFPNDSHQCPRGIRTRKPSKTLPADPRLRPLGHCDCPSYSSCAVDNRYVAWCLVQSLLSLFR